MTLLRQNWVGNDISVLKPAWGRSRMTFLSQNWLQFDGGFGNRHNCTRTGLGRLKMTSLCQNRNFSISKFIQRIHFCVIVRFPCLE